MIFIITDKLLVVTSLSAC